MSSMLTSSLVIAVAVLLVAIGGVDGQGIVSNATCIASFDWAENSEGQNPCLVAAYLLGQCNDGDYSVPALEPDHLYIPPTVITATPCACSTVTYALISACSACQQEEFVSWEIWQTNCSSVIYVTTFPDAIPEGTSVPGWAYGNWTNGFDVVAAETETNLPESTAVAPSKSTGTPSGTNTPTQPTSSSSTTSSTSTSAGNSPSSTPSNPVQHSDAGAIAGGVVGGVLGLAIIAGILAYFLIRRHRENTLAPSSIYAQQHRDNNPYGMPQMAQSGRFSPVPGSAGLHPKLYDPSDPSTFPPSPGPATLNTTTSEFRRGHRVGDSGETSGPFSSQYSIGHRYNISGGQYTGVPEV